MSSPPASGERKALELEDYPEWAQAVLREREVQSAQHVADCTERLARRLRRGSITGAVAALVGAPLLGNSPLAMALLMTPVGALGGYVVVQRECSPITGAILYGALCIVMSSVAHAAGLTTLFSANAFQNTFLFGWVLLVVAGSLVAILNEQERGHQTPY